MSRLIAHAHHLAEAARWPTLRMALLASLLTRAGGLGRATRHSVRSRFPPALIAGQLTFDAARRRGRYAGLAARGTPDVYRQVQWVDFVSNAGSLATLVVLPLMLAEAHHGEPAWQQLALRPALVGPVIASADRWENLVTLSGLGAPTSFAASLVVLASTRSAVKWRRTVFGTSLVMVQRAALAWHRIGRNRAPRLTGRPRA